MPLSRIECVIKPFKLNEVMEALIQFGVGGMTVGEVMSLGGRRSGAPGEGDPPSEWTPQIKLEVLLPSDQVSEVIELIARAARTTHSDDGVIAVSRIVSLHRVRTGEAGIDAV
jgi:nitrogen regulatory protein PII